MEKMLSPEHGELHNVYMKQLTLELWIYQKIATVFNISACNSTSRITGPFYSNCSLGCKI